MTKNTIKFLTLTVLALFIILVSLSFVSAASRYHYTSSKTTNYNKDVDYIDLGYWDYSKTTSYVKTVTVLNEDPNYYKRFDPYYTSSNRYSYKPTYNRYTPTYYYGSQHTATPQKHYAKKSPYSSGYSYTGYTYPSFPNSRYHRYY